MYLDLHPCLLHCQNKMRKRPVDSAVFSWDRYCLGYRLLSDLSVMVFTGLHASVLVEMLLKRRGGCIVGWPSVCIYVHMCLCALRPPPGHPGPSLVTTWLFSLLAVPKISNTIINSLLKS